VQLFIWEFSLNSIVIYYVGASACAELLPIF
jgi:hypothetical protein